MFAKWFTAPGNSKPQSRTRKLQVTALESRDVPSAYFVGDGMIVTDEVVTEGQTVIFKVTPARHRDVASNFSSLSVRYTVVPVSAKAGEDYHFTSRVLSWGPGDRSSREVRVGTIDDRLPEPRETFQLVLEGVRRDPATQREVPYTKHGTATIRDNDAHPQVDIRNHGANSVLEGNPEQSIGIPLGGGPVGNKLAFQVALSHPSAFPITVGYQTVDGTATLRDSDYYKNQGTLKFNPGETTKIIHVTVRPDKKVEASETFFVRLSGPRYASLGVSQATGTILNDDSSPGTPANPKPPAGPIAPPAPNPGSPKPPSVTPLPTLPMHDKAVVYRDGTWLFDLDGKGGKVEQQIQFGLPGDTPILADFNKDGRKDLVVVRSNYVRGGLDWYFDYNRDGKVDDVKHFGLLGDIPLATDFNGDGRADMIAVRSNPTRGGLDWYIDTKGDGYLPEEIRYFGLLGDKPIVGDWDGDRRGDLGVLRVEGHQQIAYLDLDRLGNHAEQRRVVGNKFDQIVIGDWINDGRSNFGAVQSQPLALQWYLDFTDNDRADSVLTFGKPGDIVLAGF